MKNRNNFSQVLVLLAALAPMLVGTGCSEKARLERLALDFEECANGDSMPSKYFCDLITDCRDGSDEASCFEFACRGDGETVYLASRCDGYEDCDNGNDEEDCDRDPYFSDQNGNNGTNNGQNGYSNNNDSEYPYETNNGEYGDYLPAPGEIGSACEYSGDCPWKCLTSENPSRRFYEGYCSASCSGDHDCPTGSHCSRNGECLDDCSSDDECRGNGYSCQDADRDNRWECFGAAEGSTPFGGNCSAYTDCTGGEQGTCLNSPFSNGYCSSLCGESTYCPSSSICLELASGEYCLVECGAAEQCSSGSCQDYNGYRVCLP